MPYSGASDKGLPDKVKKMSTKARQIYSSTFNAVYKRNGNKDTGKAGNAFAIALRAAQNWEKKKHGTKSAEDSTFTDGAAPAEPKEWAFFGPIALAQLKAEMPEWIPLHMIGEWNDLRYGDFSMTLKKMENAQANFYSCAHRPNAPVDAQVPIDTRHSGDGAGGWLNAMTIYEALNDTYLLGKPNWTPKGEEIVGQKLFRFISPLYMEEGDDVLIKEVTLTNRAFLDMPPVGVPIMLSSDIQDPIILRAIEESQVKKLDETFDEHETRIREALREQFSKPSEPAKVSEDWYPWPKGVYEDYLIVKKDSKLYKIPHSEDKEGNITFGDWQEVEVTYKPVKKSKSTTKKQEEAKMPKEKEKGLDQDQALEEEKPKSKEAKDKGLADEQLVERIKQLETQLGTLTTDNKDKTDRLLSLERERHDMLVEKHIKAAENRGIPPVIIKCVKPVMDMCHEDAERIISLGAEGDDKDPSKANIFEAMVRLLEECPSRLGVLTTGPEGNKLEERASTEADQTVEARLKELKEGEEEARKFAKKMDWDVIPADATDDAG